MQAQPPNRAALQKAAEAWRRARTSPYSWEADIAAMLNNSADEIGLFPEEVEILARTHLSGPTSASQLADALGGANEPAIEAHLGALKGAGLVQPGRQNGSLSDCVTTSDGDKALSDFQLARPTATLMRRWARHYSVARLRQGSSCRRTQGAVSGAGSHLHTSGSVP